MVSSINSVVSIRSERWHTSDWSCKPVAIPSLVYALEIPIQYTRSWVASEDSYGSVRAGIFFVEIGRYAFRRITAQNFSRNQLVTNRVCGAIPFQWTLTSSNTTAQLHRWNLTMRWLTRYVERLLSNRMLNEGKKCWVRLNYSCNYKMQTTARNWPFEGARIHCSSP